jgi:hypothetical protein
MANSVSCVLFHAVQIMLAAVLLVALLRWRVARVEQLTEVLFRVAEPAALAERLLGQPTEPQGALAALAGMLALAALAQLLQVRPQMALVVAVGVLLGVVAALGALLAAVLVFWVKALTAREEVVQAALAVQALGDVQNCTAAAVPHLLLVAGAQYALFIPARLAASHQRTQVISNA